MSKPCKMKDRPERCSALIIDRGSGLSFPRPRQCSKTSVFCRAGKYYCRLHDPITKRAAHDKKTAQREAEHQQRMERFRQEQLTVEKGKKYDALLDDFKSVRDALKNMVGAFDTPVAWRAIPNQGFALEARQSARAALEKIGDK